MRFPNGNPPGMWMACETPSSKWPRYSLSTSAVEPREMYGKTRGDTGAAVKTNKKVDNYHILGLLCR
jgi:hypothetical protein